LGNSYKVRLALAQLRIPYRLVEVDILRGEGRTPEFLAKNPNGQVPLLEVAPGRYIAESNAILWYLAGGSALAAEDRITRAEALQWMFFEQHRLVPRRPIPRNLSYGRDSFVVSSSYLFGGGAL
jgi:glutathione S-transferase